MITVATLGIESATLSEGFEQSGLAATVFADKECDIGPERQIYFVREGADIERVSGSIKLFGKAYHATQKRGAGCG